jgi:hypothetical protein
MPPAKWCKVRISVRAKQAASASSGMAGAMPGCMPPGNYSFTVNAVRGGEKVAAETLQIGVVSALVRGKSGFRA